MKMTRLTILALAVTFAANSSTILPAAAGQGCGWANENGKMVFLGTCPHDSSDDSNPVEGGCGTITYRMDLATSCAG